MGMGRARDCLEELLREYLVAGPFTEKRARQVALDISARVSDEDLRRLAGAVGGQEVPWSPASGMALSVAVHDARQGETAFVDSPCGRVTAEAELERLLDRFEEWREAQDGED